MKKAKPFPPDEDGGFAAVLRKLAQQTPGYPSPHTMVKNADQNNEEYKEQRSSLSPQDRRIGFPAPGREEEKKMKSMHYHGNNTEPGGDHRPPSPRFYAPPRQPSCPVHGGHEKPHPFDKHPFPPHHHPPHPLFYRRDEHPRHPLHPQDRKEHRALEEDLRRRGMDYRWSVPPHLLDENYRRHVHPEHPHPFKDPGPFYLPPFYYGARGEHPLVDPASYLHGGDIRAPVPREYYRRPPPPKHEGMHRTLSMESLKRRYDEAMMDRKRMEEFQEKKQERASPYKIEKMPFFQGINVNTKSPPKSHDVSRQPNSVHSLINSPPNLRPDPRSNPPDPRSELQAASILANMTSISQSPRSDSSASPPKPIRIEPKTEVKKEEPVKEESQEKLSFMLTIGLVTHSRSRALKDEIESKRWDRKFRKFRGRPRKKSKNEDETGGSSEEISEFDYYSGPMTRQKQQMLQEQETLLEEIQKRNSTETQEQRNDEALRPNDIKEVSVVIDRNEAVVNGKRYQSSDETHVDSKRTKTNDNHSESQENKPNQAFKKVDELLEPSHSTNHNNNKALENNHIDQTRPADSRHDRYETHENERALHERKHYTHHRAEANGFHPRFHPMEHAHHDFRWPGIEQVGHAYKAYHAELEAKRHQLAHAYESLQREGRSGVYKRELLEQDLMINNERRMRLEERSRVMHHSLENMKNSLRTMSRF